MRWWQAFRKEALVAKVGPVRAIIPDRAPSLACQASVRTTTFDLIDSLAGRDQTIISLDHRVFLTFTIYRYVLCNIEGMIKFYYYAILHSLQYSISIRHATRDFPINAGGLNFLASISWQAWNRRLRIPFPRLYTSEHLPPLSSDPSSASANDSDRFVRSVDFLPRYARGFKTRGQRTCTSLERRLAPAWTRVIAALCASSSSNHFSDSFLRETNRF